MKRLKRLDSNETVIGYFKEKVENEKKKNLKEAWNLIETRVKYRSQMDEEDAVENLFGEVEEVLKTLPDDAELPPRKIARAIFMKPPSYNLAEKGTSKR